jgi:hypothetical protein
VQGPGPPVASDRWGVPQSLPYMTSRRRPCSGRSSGRACVTGQRGRWCYRPCGASNTYLTSPGEADPVAVGDGHCGNVDPSGGHVGPERQALAEERDTHSPRRGDEDHCPNSTPHTIGLLAAATGQRGRSARRGRVRGDKALVGIRREGKQ